MYVVHFEVQGYEGTVQVTEGGTLTIDMPIEVAGAPVGNRVEMQGHAIATAKVVKVERVRRWRRK